MIHLTRCRAVCLAAVLCGWAGVCSGQAVAKPAAPAEFKIFGAQILPGVEDFGWTPDQTPADFLDRIGRKIKARWRQHYRAQPVVPSNERHRTALLLGSVLAEGFLALQASDAQQFRNANQDVTAFCRALGLGEKLTPRLMSQGKLAETENWADLRQEVVDGHQEIGRLLKEQMDADLVVLIDIGLWLRLLQVVSAIVVDGGEPALYPLCIGSKGLVADMLARYRLLTKTTLEEHRVSVLGQSLEAMQKAWSGDEEVSKERVIWTHEKLDGIQERLNR